MVESGLAEHSSTAAPDDAPATAENGLRLSVLGPVVVIHGPTGPVDLNAAAQRLLRLLAAHHPAPVAIEDAADAVYPAEPPERARRALHTAVWRLRRQLPDGALATGGGSYRLDLPLDDVDLTRFERLADDGRAALLAGRYDAVLDACGDALDLWPGSASELSRELPGIQARHEGAEGTRDAAVEDWAEAGVRLGRARPAVARLGRLTADQPLRERAWALLLDGHRSLAQWADVAAAAARARAALTEVGIEPGAELAAALARARQGDAPRPRRPAEAPLPSWLRLSTEHGPFVGRATERDALLAAIGRADAGRIQVALVTGEPGIGKTRLVAEVGVLAAGQGRRLLGGRCDPHRAVPYAALFDALSRLLALLDPAAAAQFLDGPLGRLLSAASTDGAIRADAGGEQLALFDAVADLLRATAGDVTTVLVVDDLQWASQGTLLLLRHVVRTAPDLRLCVLAARRHGDDADEVTAALARDLQASSGAEVVPLDGLSVRELAAHPDLVAGDEDRLVVAERLLAQTGGNPLFVTTLFTGGGTARTPILAAAIAAHLARLDPGARRVLALAAVLGREYDPARLRAAALRPPLSVDAAEVHRGLDAAEAAGIIAPARAGATYEFRHELLRTSLLDELPTTDRASLHLAVAEVIAAGPGADVAPGLFTLATHLHAAGPVVDAERILDAARRAAHLATRNLDFAGAAHYSEMAATSAGRVASEEEADLLVQAAASWRCATRQERSVECLDAAMSRARANAWPVAFARAAAARGEHELELDGRLSAPCGQAIDLARSQLPDQERALDAQLRFLRVMDSPPSRRVTEALVEGRDDDASTEAVMRALWIASIDDRPDLAAHLVAVATPPAPLRLRALALLADWVVAVEHGRASIDDPVADEITELVEASGDAELAWVDDSWTAARHLAAGRFDRAPAVIERAYRRVRGTTLSIGRRAQAFVIHRAQTNQVAYFTGRDGRFDDYAETVHRLWTVDPDGCDRMVAFSHARAGRLDDARPLFERTVDRLLDDRRLTSSRPFAVALASQVAALLADHPRATSLLDAIAPFRGRQCLFRNSALSGAADHYAGVLHRTVGEFDSAMAAFTSAHALNRAQGLRLWTALNGLETVRTLFLRGAPGDHPEASRRAAEVAAECRELGLTWMATELDKVA